MKTVLNLGMGADSAAILARWIKEPASRDFDLERDLIVITSMVGDEWPDTKRLMEEHLLPLMREHRIRFVQVARGGHFQKDGYVVLDDSRSSRVIHLGGAYKLSDEMIETGTIPTASRPRKCSLKFKGEVIDPWLRAEFGDEPFRQVIGFNADETGRVERDLCSYTKSSFKGQRHAWFPLVDWGWGRAKLEDYLEDSFGEPWAKSACYFCPFATDHVLPRFRMFPELGVKALEMEHAALAFNPRMKLFKRKSLREVLEADGQVDIIEAFDRKQAGKEMAVFRVRRVFRMKDGDSSKKGNAVRFLENVASGSIAEVQAALAKIAGEVGREVEIDENGISRIRVQEIGKVFPCREDGFVIAPASVASKKGPGFDKAWASAK